MVLIFGQKLADTVGSGKISGEMVLILRQKIAHTVGLRKISE